VVENIVLWLASFLLYGNLFLLARSTLRGMEASVRQSVTTLGIAALLTLPINVDGNVFTLFGNAAGEKGVYSISSFYQRSGGDALTIIGLGGYQEAEQDTTTVLGITGYQKAGQNAALDIGLAGYQKAKQNATLYLGLAGYQKAGQNVVTLAGVAGYQKAGQNAALGIGLAGYQEADQEVVTLIGVAGYQRVGPATRTFGALAPLSAPGTPK